MLGLTFGEPLLGITRYTLDGGAAGEVRVAQVQTNLVSNQGVRFSLFTDVPYAIGCSTLDGSVAFDACAATSQDWFGPMAELSAPSADVVLAAAAGIDTDTGDTGVVHGTQAVWVALLANSRVLPGAMPNHGILDRTDAPPATFLDTPSSATWMLLCGRGSAGADDCSAPPDLDGDGFRMLGDCNDLDAGTFPSAVDPAGPEWVAGDLDTNCDGWPADFWIAPPALQP